MLPNEILQCIFLYFQPTLRRKGFRLSSEFVSRQDEEEEIARQQTLARISRASKRFYHLVVPILYHTIPVISDELLWALSHNSALAENVRAIDLCSPRPYGTPPAKLLEAFEAARPRLNLNDSFKSRLLEAIRNAEELDTGAEEVLYLLLLPNLVALEYRCYWRANPIVLDFFAGRSNAPVPAIRELRIRHSDTEDTTSIAEVHRMLQPSVERLFAWAISWAWGPDEHLSQLQQLELVDGVINDSGLSDILGRCPRMHTLRIIWGSPRRKSRYSLDFESIGDTLRRHACGLEALTLDCEDDPSYTAGESIGRLGSLRELTRLRMLSLQQDVLVGEDSADQDGRPKLQLDQVLPDSIEQLHLLRSQGNEEDLDTQVISLLQRNSQFTRVSRIHVSRSDEFPSEQYKLSFKTSVDEAGFELYHEWNNMILTKRSLV